MYDIDPDGDTTLSDYGGYTAEGGKLVFNKVIKAQTRPLTRRVTAAGRTGAAAIAAREQLHGIRIHPRTTGALARRRRA